MAIIMPCYDQWSCCMMDGHMEKIKLNGEGKNGEESERMTHACKRPPTTTKRNIWLFYIRLLLRPFAIHIISQLQTLHQSTNSRDQRQWSSSWWWTCIRIKETCGQGRFSPEMLIDMLITRANITTKQFTTTTSLRSVM